MEVSQRDAAILAIRSIGGPEAARRLTGIVGREDASVEAMVAALGALTEMRHAPAQSVAARRTHHSAAEVRAAALAALVALEGESATERLVAALSDTEPAPRIAALQGLAAVEARQAIPQRPQRSSKRTLACRADEGANRRGRGGR